MAEIFIHEWHISDYDGRREPSMMSEGTINGEHVYACKRLSTWFRLGDYLIKHDQANYLLGLTRNMSRDEFRHNVKVWDWNKETNTMKHTNCVDEIVNLVNQHFSGNDYVNTLLMLQEELKGYEKCYYISDCYRLDFDYKLFIKDKDAYQKQLEDFIRRVHEEEQQITKERAEIMNCDLLGLVESKQWKNDRVMDGFIQLNGRWLTADEGRKVVRAAIKAGYTDLYSVPDEFAENILKNE